jgi:hypothetical protein
VAKKKKQTQSAAAQQPVAATRVPMSGSEWVVWVCLHLLVFMVPLAMSNTSLFGGTGLPLTFDQFDIAKVFIQRGLMLVAVGAWSWGILLQGGRIRFTKVEWLVLAFLAWLVVTSALSVHPATATCGKYRRFEGVSSFIN